MKNCERGYIIYGSELDVWQTITPQSPMCQELRQSVRSRPIVSISSERNYQDDDCIWMTPEEEEKRIRKHERDITLEKAIAMFDNGNYSGQTIKKMLLSLGCWE